LVVLGNAKRRRFGVHRVQLFPNVRRAQNAEPLRIGRHQPVLDAVVDHLDEMTRPTWSAMQVAGFGGAGRGPLPSRRTRDIADTWGEGFEDRIQTLNRRFRPSDHHAVATFKTPDAAAGANVNVMNSLGSYFPGAPYVVDVIGIAAIDQNVSRFHERQQVADRFVYDRRGHHQPDRSGLFEFFHEIRQRRAAGRLVLHQVRHRIR
jgi:hypothetical protein